MDGLDGSVFIRLFYFIRLFINSDFIIRYNVVAYYSFG